jgi:hypothetical protein
VSIRFVSIRYVSIRFVKLLLILFCYDTCSAIDYLHILQQMRTIFSSPWTVNIVITLGKVSTTNSAGVQRKWQKYTDICLMLNSWVDCNERFTFAELIILSVDCAVAESDISDIWCTTYYCLQCLWSGIEHKCWLSPSCSQAILLTKVWHVLDHHDWFKPPWSTSNYNHHHLFCSRDGALIWLSDQYYCCTVYTWPGYDKHYLVCPWAGYIIKTIG